MVTYSSAGPRTRSVSSRRARSRAARIVAASNIMANARRNSTARSATSRSHWYIGGTVPAGTGCGAIGNSATTTGPSATKRASGESLATRSRIEGIERAALAAVYPTQQRANNRDRFALLLDVGATVHCRPQDLLFFAYMGHAYASRISKVERPTFGLLNMGSEPTKGGETLVAAHALLRGEPRLNFIGNVEGNDIPLGKADVIVCEGLLGNVALKMAEGTGELFRNLGTWAFKQSLLWKLGLLLLSSGLRRLKDLTDYSEYGGAPLLGFTRPIIKAHGRSSAQAIGNAIKVAAKAARDGVCTDIAACARDFAAKQAQA